MNTLALLVAISFGGQTPTTPARIIVIRHAEKPDDPNDPHLSPQGRKRAKLLVTFLTSNAEVNQFGAPVAVFATRETKDGDGVRTSETIGPYAAAAHLALQMPYTGKDFLALAKLILREPRYAGKTIVICWNHEFIPQLAAALGVSPPPRKWKGADFDSGYDITYHNGRAALTQMVENLSPR